MSKFMSLGVPDVIEKDRHFEGFSFMPRQRRCRAPGGGVKGAAPTPLSDFFWGGLPYQDFEEKTKGDWPKGMGAREDDENDTI